MLKSILKSFLCICCLSIWFAVSAAAGDSHGYKKLDNEANTGAWSDNRDLEEDRLTMILKDMTDVATKNRMNADFVPGIITVLHGEDLEARGVRTLIEALRLAPGVDMNFSSLGIGSPRARGIGNPLSHGNFKILLNGSPINTTFRMNPAPDMPVEQIERIDITRGPTSAIYGEFGLFGVVDIITRKKGVHLEKNNRIFGSMGDGDAYLAGGILSMSIPGKKLKMCLNAAASQSGGPGFHSGPDKPAVFGPPTYAPGPLNERGELENVFYNLEYKDFSFQAELMSHRQEDFFSYSLPLHPSKDRIVPRDLFWGVEARQKINVRDRLNAEITLGWQRQSLEVGDAFLLKMHQEEKMTFDMHQDEDIFRTAVEFRWTGDSETRDGRPLHNVLLGLSLTHNKYGDIWFRTNFHPLYLHPKPEARYDGEAFGLYDELSRTTSSITFQDEYHASDHLTFTAGLRYDYYSDLVGNVSPRFAMVYRMNKHHVFKGQYTRTFRPPTLVEMRARDNVLMIGNPDLESEINDAFSLGYIYRNEQTVVRATLFHSEINHLIEVVDGQRSNMDSVRLRGVQLELERQLVMNILKLDANISTVDNTNSSTNKAIPGTAEWLINAGLIYRPFSFLTLAGQYRYVGKRLREPEDSREDLSAYHTVDLTGTVTDLPFKGFTIRAGIKNLFDEDVRYPAPLLKISGFHEPSHPEDYPRTGREWWMQVCYDF